MGQYQTNAAAWRAHIGKSISTTDKILIDLLDGFDKLYINGYGGRDLLELYVPIDGDTCNINDLLKGKELWAIVGEDNAGNMIDGVELKALIAGVTASAFTERWMLKYSTAPTFKDVTRVRLPAIYSTDLQINFNTGHGLIALHIYYLEPRTNEISDNMKSYTTTVDFEAATPQTITHNLGRVPSVVTFLKDGEPIELTWSVSDANPTTQIVVESSEALTGVTINVIA